MPAIAHNNAKPPKNQNPDLWQTNQNQATLSMHNNLLIKEQMSKPTPIYAKL
jgi:hypothetical protein